MNRRVFLSTIVIGLVLAGLVGAAGWQNRNRARMARSADSPAASTECPGMTDGSCDGPCGAGMCQGMGGCGGQGMGWCGGRGNGNCQGMGMGRQMRMRNGAGMNCPFQQGQ